MCPGQCEGAKVQEIVKGCMKACYFSAMKCWPRNDLDYTPHPWIDPVALQQLATSLQYPDLTHVNYVAKNLTNGWRIGATGAGRLHAIGHNLSSFFEHGYKEWISKRIYFH